MKNPMKNLTHMSVQGTSSPEAMNNNMADDGNEDRTFDWTEYLMSQAFCGFGPVVEAGSQVVEEGMCWNHGVVEGMEKSCVVGESMGKKAAEWMVGAPPSGLGEQGPVNNEEYSRFVLHLLQSSSFAVGVSGSEMGMGPEWMVGGAPPPPGSMDKSVLIPAGGDGGSDDGYSGFPSQALHSVVGVEAPCENLNLGKKRAAARMGSAPPGARASKRRRSLSGSIETSEGSNYEATWSGFSHEAAMVAALENVWRTEPVAVWWRDTVNSPGYTDADFKRDFHISRSTFDILCKMLASSVGKDGHRATITVPQRVAICVFCLATGARYREVSDRFNICISICHKTVREVAAAINTIVQLRPDSAKDMAAAAEKFQALTGGIPGVIGAVYTAHFLIIAPGHHVSNYYNPRLTKRRKGKTSYSVALHAAVDADGAFLDIFAGNPGAMSDEEIFSLSSRMVAQGKCLVGGAAYPLTDCTLVPYTHSNLTLPEREFNKKLALGRGVAVDAFRRLKARWACLQPDKRGMGKPLTYLSSVMEACCVLHNFCERNGDELGDELKGFELEDDEMLLDNPVRSDAAAQVRDAIAHNLLHGSTMAVPPTTK